MLQSLIKTLKQLSYTDMLVVADEVSRRLNTEHQPKIDANILAGVLARLSPADLGADDQSRQEEEILRKIFNTKRTISVQRGNNGWCVGIPTIAGSQAVGVELRHVLGQCLDQAITLHVLKG